MSILDLKRAKNYTDNKIVTPMNTSFLIKGKNLIDTAQPLYPSMAVNPDYGTRYSNIQHIATDYIAVEPDTAYVINKDYCIAFFNESKEYISGLAGTMSAGTSFTTPLLCKYIIISVRYYNTNPNIINETQLEKGTVSSEYEPYCFKLDQDIIKLMAITPEDCSFFGTGKNLIDVSSTLYPGYGVEYNNGTIYLNSQHIATDYIKVDPSTDYVINQIYCIACYDAAKIFIPAITGTISAGTPFKTPANCLYIRISVRPYDTNPNIINETQLEKGVVVTSFTPFKKDVLNGDNLELPDIATSQYAKFHTLKWNSLGDSITEANKYQTFVKTKLGFPIVRNYGVGGAGLVDMETSFSAMDNDADIISVLGGTNDWGRDVTLTTLTTTIQTIIEGLIAKYPGKYIVWATLPQRNNTTYPDGVNANGDSTADYAQTIKNVCMSYSIPCIDLHNESGINKFNMVDNGALMPDGVHPSDAGHKRIASLFIDMFNKVVY